MSRGARARAAADLVLVEVELRRGAAARRVRLLPQREKRRTKEQGTWKVLFAHPCIYARRLVDWVYRSGVHSTLPRVVLAGVDFEFVLVPHLIHHVHVLEVTLI